MAAQMREHDSTSRRDARVDDQSEGWMPRSDDDEASADVDVAEWLRRHRARQPVIELEDEDRFEMAWESPEVDQREDAWREEPPVWIDMSEVDALYAESAARGMADADAKSRAVDVAADHAAAQAARPGEPQPVVSQHERARAAQRWEQNREYMESQHQERRL